IPAPGGGRVGETVAAVIRWGTTSRARGREPARRSLTPRLPAVHQRLVRAPGEDLQPPVGVDARRRVAGNAPPRASQPDQPVGAADCRACRTLSSFQRANRSSSPEAAGITATCVPLKSVPPQRLPVEAGPSPVGRRVVDGEVTGGHSGGSLG